MSDTKALENEIIELESKIKILEEKLNLCSNNSDKQYMAALYEKAKELVVKNNKASAIFLQKSLFIDFQRASDLINLLEKNGIIGKLINGESRKIL